MDDDDAFLYGDEDGSVVTNEKEEEVKQASSEQGDNVATVPTAVESELSLNLLNGVQVDREGDEQPMEHSEDDGLAADVPNGEDEEEEEDEQDEQDEDTESDDDDLEIILQPQPRSIDFRDPSQQRPIRPAAASPVKSSSLLTTEYTPRERDASFTISKGSATSQPANAGPTGTKSTGEPVSTSAKQSLEEDRPIPDGPPPRAASNAPEIDPSTPGMLDARSIYEVELQSLVEKPWRRAGSDLSDWFNYGFDEISWEAYCLRKKELSELSAVLKQNVIAYTGMPENQLLALPPEMRTMAIQSANMSTSMPLGLPQSMLHAMGGMPGAEMMGLPGMGTGGMQPMQQNALAAGMNGEQTARIPENTMATIHGPMAGVEGIPSDGFIHPYSAVPASGPSVGAMSDMTGTNAAPFNGLPGYNIEASTPNGEQAYATRGPGRGTPQLSRGTPPIRGILPSARGRGRGIGLVTGESLQTLPTRPASPLPPNVPTGPRNRTTYKDKDREPVKQEVEGLDYGGGTVVDSAASGRKRPYAGEEDNARSKRR